MLKYIFTMISVFAVATAAHAETSNCSVPSCAELGYQYIPAVENYKCNAYILCPYNSSYKKCVETSCAGLGFSSTFNSKYPSETGQGDKDYDWCTTKVKCTDAKGDHFLCAQGTAISDPCTARGLSSKTACDRKNGALTDYNKDNNSGWAMCGVCKTCPTGYYLHPSRRYNSPFDDWMGAARSCSPCGKSTIFTGSYTDTPYICETKVGGLIYKNTLEKFNSIQCGVCGTASNNQHFVKGSDIHIPATEGGCYTNIYIDSDNNEYQLCNIQSKCSRGEVSKEQCDKWNGISVSSGNTNTSITNETCAECKVAPSGYEVFEGDNINLGENCTSSFTGLDGKTYAFCMPSSCGTQVRTQRVIQTPKNYCLMSNITYTGAYNTQDNGQQYTFNEGKEGVTLTLAGKLTDLWSNVKIIINENADAKDIRLMNGGVFNAPLKSSAYVDLRGPANVEYDFSNSHAGSNGNLSDVVCVGRNPYTLVFDTNRDDFGYTFECEGKPCRVGGVEGTMSAEGKCVPN